MRHSLLAGVLEAAERNLKHTDDVRWFGRLEGDAGSSKAAMIARGVRVARARGLLHSFVEGPIPEPVAFPGRWDDTLFRMGPYFDRGIRAVGEGPLLLVVEPSGAIRETSFAAQPTSGGGGASCAGTRSCRATVHAISAPPASMRFSISLG